MDITIDDHAFPCVLSLKSLIDYWTRRLADGARRPFPEGAGFEARLAEAPELTGPIGDFGVLEHHRALIEELMTAVFPAAYWDTVPFAAVVPFSLQPFVISPEFRRWFLNSDGTLRGRPYLEGPQDERARLMRAYSLILRQCYGIDLGNVHPSIRVVPDPATGLDRYFRLNPDFRFVEVRNLAGPERLTEEQQRRILDWIAEPERLREILHPEHYEFRGFSVVEPVDVTESVGISELERDLVDEDSIVSESGFTKIQQRLRILFRRPELTAAVAAIQGDLILLVNRGCELARCCIFSGSRHVPASEFDGSVFDRASQREGVLRVRDLLDEPSRTPVDEDLLAHGIRALIAAPLNYNGELIGMLQLGSSQPGDFGYNDSILAEQLAPLFSMALKRSVDELENQVQGIIKEKCTAVHPSVEWRFRTSVFDHLERAYRGETSELEPVVFSDVFALYGAADIRGSSAGRNQAIRDDLTEHLGLAQEVVRKAGDARRLFILDELSYRIQLHADRIEEGFGTGDEAALLQFIRREVEPVFEVVAGFGAEVGDAVERYHRAIDPSKGTVYLKRKAFEDSVSAFNERISAYLDREEAQAQHIFPHYFDKHQTDGVNYVIYMGASMVEDGGFDQLFVRNMRIWQLMVACGMAWQAEELKACIRVPLTCTHLILVNQSPLAIRFRFDEKRFDVDGAYNVGHEIIRSRIDKATVTGTGERLTQPGKIAIVYSRQDEYLDIRRHVEFLRGRGFLAGDAEELDLADMPDVKGMKAIRVQVDMESTAVRERVERVMSR